MMRHLGLMRECSLDVDGVGYRIGRDRMQATRSPGDRSVTKGALCRGPPKSYELIDLQQRSPPGCSPSGQLRAADDDAIPEADPVTMDPIARSVCV
jgi:hypothetical protein